jgi:hypothetical protein
MSQIRFQLYLKKMEQREISQITTNNGTLSGQLCLFKRETTCNGHKLITLTKRVWVVASSK